MYTLNFIDTYEIFDIQVDKIEYIKLKNFTIVNLKDTTFMPPILLNIELVPLKSYEMFHYKDIYIRNSSCTEKRRSPECI